MVFVEQNHEGIDVWMKGFEHLRLPKTFDLYADPFERGDESILYSDWMIHHAPTIYGAQALVADWLKSFKEFPPRQKPASFNLDLIMQKMTAPSND